jgi:hypothetical protein
MSAEEERSVEAVKDPAPAEQETQEPEPEVASKAEASPLSEVSGWTESDDEERVGWLVVSDGEQEVFPHPEGKTRREVIEGFLKAKSKKHSAFELGMVVLDPEAITTFAWSKDIMFPEIEKFDSIQERMEFLAEALGELTTQQAALQEAQAALIQDELGEIQAESEGAYDEEGEPPLEPEVLPAEPAAAPQPAKPKRKAFRPPGA